MRRRTFIGLGLLAAAGAGLGYWLRDRLVGTRSEILPNPEETLAAMVAMVEPVVGRSAAEATAWSLDPYRSLFQWRFENVPGEGDRQRKFARLLNELAHGRTGLGFSQCDPSTRREILEAALDSPSGREAGVALTGLIVRLFAHTDSWTLLGYQAPPGTPRGLDLYVQSPS